MMVIFVIRMIGVIFAGNRKASKEEQGRKYYNNDS
jgi:hypothetical protein